MTRAVMWALLAVVAGSAAVLSFASLRGLAVLCGFAPGLAPLLPVVIDAGAAAGCLVWLGSTAGQSARRYARGLTVSLLLASVAGNALVHYLGTYGLRPAWWLVVAVSAAAPAVLGAVVHLAVLTAQGRTAGSELDAEPQDDQAQGDDTPGSDPVTALIQSGAGRRRLARELSITEHEARQLLASRNGAGR